MHHAAERRERYQIRRLRKCVTKTLDNNASGSDSLEQLADGQRSRNFSTFGTAHLAGALV